jgi:hypothetical protein
VAVDEELLDQSGVVDDPRRPAGELEAHDVAVIANAALDE